MDSTDRSAGANDGILGRAVSRLRGTATSSLILWTYLVLITIAELLISIGPPIPPQAGLVLHTLILVGLTMNTVIGFDEAGRKLALALTLGPLIRILSVGMPLRSVPQLVWYPLVSAPLLLATWLIIRQAGVSRRSLGLQRGDLRTQLMLIGGGLGLGALEYVILHPAPLLPTLSLQTILVTFLILLIFTGFSEELIFRGLLQTLALPVLGRWALTYVALLFGVLHIGYLSFWDVVFVFSVGFLFAYIVHWGGSILGVTLAHGITNTMLFLVLPYLAERPDHLAARLMPWIVGIGSAISLVAVGRLWLLAHPELRPSLPIPQARAAARRATRLGTQGARLFPRLVQFRTAFAFVIGTFFGLAVSGLIFDLRNRPDTVAVAPTTIAAGAAAETPAIEATEETGTVEAAETPEQDVTSAVVAASPTLAATATAGATRTPAPGPTTTIAELPWPEFVPDGLTLAVADSWPFQMIGPDQLGQPFLVFRDDERWLVLRRQPAGTPAIPASAEVERLKVGEAPATLVSYPDDGITISWEQDGMPLQISAMGITVDDAVRTGQRIVPQTPAELQQRLAEAATEAEIEVTALWPFNLPAGFAIVPAETSMEFGDPSDDASLAGYAVTFAQGDKRVQVGGGTLAPPQVNGTSERISAGGRSATLISGQDRFLLTLEGDGEQLAVPAGSSPVLPLVQSGRVFVLAENISRAELDQLLSGLLPLRPQEFAARASGQPTRELPYLWPATLPEGYSLDLESVRTSWQDYLLQGGRPFYSLTARAADGAELTLQGGGDAYVVPEGAEVEVVTARVHGQGATAVSTDEGVVVFWTEQGTFFTLSASALELEEAVAVSNSLQSIPPDTFAQRIQ